MSPAIVEKINAENKESLIKKALLKLNKMYHQGVTLAKIAERVGCSKAYLSRAKNGSTKLSENVAKKIMEIDHE